MEHDIIRPFGKPLCRKCGMPAPWIDENPCFLAKAPRGGEAAQRKALRAFERGE